MSSGFNAVHHYARGSLILLVGQVLSTVINAAGVILVARLLGATDYGYVALAAIPVSVASLFSDLGVSQALTRYIAQFRSEGRAGDARAAVSAGVAINAATGALLSLAVFLLSGFIAADVLGKPEVGVLVRVSSASLAAQALITTAQSIFIGFERMELHSLTSTLFSTLKSTLAPALVIWGYGAYGAVVGATVSLAATGALGLLAVMSLLRSSPRGGVGAARQSARALLDYGFPLFLSGLLSGGATQLYSLIMAIYVEASEVGNYQVATHFSVLIALMAMPIATVLFPLFSKIDGGDWGALDSAFRRAVKYTAFILVPLTAAIMATSDRLVRIIYGDSYLLAPFFLRLYAVNYLFDGLGGIGVANLLKGQGMTRVTLKMNLVNLVMGLPLGLFLIPRLGATGLLLTIVAATKSGLFYALWWIKRNLGLTVDWRASAKILLASGAASLAAIIPTTLMVLDDWPALALMGLTMLIVYALLVSAAGALERSDLQKLREAASAFGPLAPLFRVFMRLVEGLSRLP